MTWTLLCALLVFDSANKCLPFCYRSRLTVTTIIFLPLTLLTGYFVCWVSSFRENTDIVYRGWILRVSGASTDVRIFCMLWLFLKIYADWFHCSFWEIALPAMAILIPLLMWRDIKSLARYLKRRAETRRVTGDLKVRVKFRVAAAVGWGATMQRKLTWRVLGDRISNGHSVLIPCSSYNL